MKTLCPHCGKPINPASLLAARGRNKPKNFTASERRRRSSAMKAMRAKQEAARRKSIAEDLDRIKRGEV